MDDEMEKSFGDLLKKTGLKTPPAGLTDKIMLQIDSEAAKAPVLIMSKTPIIPVQTWWAIAACLATLILGGNYLFPSGTVSHPVPRQSLNSALYQLPGLFSSIPTEYLAGLVTLLALLTFDFLLRARHASRSRSLSGSR